MTDEQITEPEEVKKKTPVCWMKSIYDKRRDLWRVDLRVNRKVDTLIKENAVTGGTMHYRRGPDDVGTRYLVRRAISNNYSLDGVLGVVWDKGEIDKASKKRVVYVNDFEQAEYCMRQFKELIQAVIDNSLNMRKELKAVVSIEG